MGWTPTNVCPKVMGRGGVRVQFTVGLKLNGKTDHIAVDAEDALIAALKVKTEYPEAVITYVRQQNRRRCTSRMGSPKTSFEEQFRQETNFGGKFERSVVRNSHTVRVR
jgi:hypothetical protein